MRKRFVLYVVFLALILCINIYNVNATEMTFDDVKTGLQLRLEEINKSSNCYNSRFVLEDNKIYIYYDLKVEESDICVNPDGWYTGYRYDGKIIFDNDSASHSYKFDSEKNYTELFLLDIKWFDAFLEIVGLNLNFSEDVIDNVKGNISYFKEELLYIYIGEYYSSDATNYLSGFRYILNGEIYEIDEITHNSVSLTYNEIATSSVVCIGSECGSSPFKLSTNNVDFHDKYKDVIFDRANDKITLVNLEPNTKYYLNIVDGVNKEYQYTFTTLAVSNDEESEDETGSNDVIIDNDKNEENNNQNNNQDNNENIEVDTDKTNNDEDKKNEIENPETGIKFSIISLIVLIISMIIIKRRKKVIYKI